MPAKPYERRCPIVQNFDVIFARQINLIEASQRAGVSPEPQQNDTPIELKINVIRLERDGSLKACERFFEASHGKLSGAEV